MDQVGSRWPSILEVDLVNTRQRNDFHVGLCTTGAPTTTVGPPPRTPRGAKERRKDLRSSHALERLPFK